MALVVSVFSCGDSDDDERVPVGDGGTCVVEPYVLGAKLSIDSSRTLTDLDIGFFPTEKLRPTGSLTPPARGTPGAADYWIARLVDQNGTVLSSLVFFSPGLTGNSGSWRSKWVRWIDEPTFAVELVSGTRRLVIQSYNTGVTLIDLDLQGHLQLLCINEPCSSFCLALDGGVPPRDGGVPDGAIPDDAADGAVDQMMAPDAVEAPMDTGGDTQPEGGIADAPQDAAPPDAGAEAGVGDVPVDMAMPVDGVPLDSTPRLDVP